MKKIRSAAAPLVLVLSNTVATAGVVGPVCGPSNAVGVEGIGDGCTIPISPQAMRDLFPDIAAFKSTFTPACNKHDKCYSTLGTSYGECDGNFLNDMRSACGSNFNPFFFPVEYALCSDTATRYYAGVVAYGSAQNPLPSIQAEALSRSRQMAAMVNADGCGTTPELTTLYSAGLMNEVNAAFMSSAGRLPTVYEFFDAVNSGNIVSDRNGWRSQLLIKAAAAAGSAPPFFTVSRSMNYVSWQVNYLPSPAAPGVSYVWKLNNMSNTGPVGVLPMRQPQYDQKWPVEGFVRATGPNGARNLVLIIDTVQEAGWCASVPGDACF